MYIVFIYIYIFTYIFLRIYVAFVCLYLKTALESAHRKHFQLLKLWLDAIIMRRAVKSDRVIFVLAS